MTGPSMLWVYLEEMGMGMRLEVEDWASLLKRLCDQRLFLVDEKAMGKVSDEESSLEALEVKACGRNKRFMSRGRGVDVMKENMPWFIC